MRLFLAIVLPWLQFFTIGRPLAIWSVYALGQYEVDRKIEAALAASRRRGRDDD
jgi:hypothetical protein